VVYEYRCEQCDYSFDVIKSAKAFTRTEKCKTCKADAILQISSNIYFSGTKTTDAAYNPAFGMVIKNDRHKRYEAEKRGMVEIGNDFGSGEKLQKHFDKVRDEKRKKVWDEE
jgi:putative FmdB family regulatory protein